MTELCRIEIPEYITHIKLSNKRRPKYYQLKGKKWKPKDLSKTLQSKLDSKEYGITGAYLVDENKQKVIANPIAAGTPKFLKLGGNDFTTGFGSPHIRNKVVTELKKFFLPFIIDQLKPIDRNDTPLIIEWELHAPIPKIMYDLSNLWFYYKYFEDCLFEKQDNNGKSITPILPDDNLQYITKPGNAPLFCPVETWEDRKFVFIFYKDDRPLIKSKELWRNGNNQ